MSFTNILLLEQHLMPDYAHPAHKTHTNKNDAVCLMTCVLGMNND